jgi:triacylglycerol esterase/lipase EstA (alpha/beta hydrolase family)
MAGVRGWVAGCGLGVALAAGAGVPVWGVTGAEPPGGEVGGAKPADAQARALRARAEGLIKGASSSVDAAIEWLASTGASLKDGSQGARKQAEEWLLRNVEAALAKEAPPTGVRLLARGSEAGTALKWLPAAEIPADLPAEVVLLIHGMDEPGSVWDDLAPLAQRGGLNVARFDYANDQAIAQSANELAAALKMLRSRGVQRVSIVAHSMGSLVSRDVLTRPEYYAGDTRARGEWPAVERLVAVAPPNHGSPLAHVRWLAEAREQLARYADGSWSDPRALLGFLKDGDGEAGDDLLPDSAFLSGLNARALPTPVKITIIAGTIGSGVEDRVRSILEWSVVKRVLSAEEIAGVEREVARLNAVVGDGIVTLDSTRLEGVSDFVQVPANHRFLLKRPGVERELRQALGEPSKVGTAIPIILQRLGAKPEGEQAPSGG